jgi:K+-transporting ATPase ATPase C chain
VERKTPTGQVEKAIGPVSEKSSDIQAVFFDMWRNAHPDVPLEEVPADMVTASGSGLDPHITLANARYQLKYRVAAAWAQKRQVAVERVRTVIEGVLDEHTEAPLSGLVGVPLVNVLEVNLAVAAKMDEQARSQR